MKYRLKDRDLQKKLDEISGGDFSPRLQDVWSTNEGRSVATFDFGDYPRDDSIWRKFTATICEDEIEAIPEYDPTRWNKWPIVEPPEKTLLRIEIITERFGEGTPEPSGGKVRCRGCATYSHGFWMLGEKITVKPRETVRFRPWDDCDEGDKK